MSTSDKTFSKRNFLSRINARWPWLKLVAVIIVGIMSILDLLDITISRTGDPLGTIRIAPMSKHVKATTRDLNGKKLVALTFDDGPSPETTPRLLDILQEKDVPATFFMLGVMARNNPDIVKRASREGHEIASHTMYHQNLIKISSSAMQSDIEESRAVFNNILGKTPSFTRPPYGNINDSVRKFVKTPMILWSVDTLDWKSRDPNSIIAVTLDEVHDGAIILMHDIYSTSVDAVPELIDTLRSNGYEFVSLPELVKIRQVDPLPGYAYYNFKP